MGTIEKHKINVKCSNEDRILRIYLPDSYYFNQEKYYPVLYMQDGQNIFTDETATYGTSWNLKKILEEREQNEGKEIIVVALDNSSSNRYNEYSPWYCTKPKSNFDLNVSYGGKGDAYSAFFVEQLIPFVENKYRIIQTPDSRSIAGSSMGAFISAYIAEKYQEMFEYVGVFSIASWFAENDFINYMLNHKKTVDQYFYVYVGTEETSDENNLYMNQLYLDNTLDYYQTLIRKGCFSDHIRLRVQAYEKHNENSWKKYIVDFLDIIQKNMQGDTNGSYNIY